MSRRLAHEYLEDRALLAVFSSADQIVINDDDAATPYPSTINVSGLSGTVSHVEVTLHNLSHTLLYDVGVLLVSPTGAKTVELLRSVGNGILDSTFTFKDGAPPMPQYFSGEEVFDTFSPTQLEFTRVYPAPAPVGPFGTTMSALNGINPNGDWQLFVVDFVPGDVGEITTGWSIDITTTADPNPVINVGGGDNNVVVRRNGDNYEVEIDGMVDPANVFPVADTESITVNGEGGDDTLTIDNNAGGVLGVPVTFNGGENGAGGDSLEVLGGSFTDVETSYTSATDGTIKLDGLTHTFTGLEPVFLAVGAVNLTFNLTGGVDNAALEDDGGAANGISRLRSINGTFEDTTFINPTGSLTINSQDAADRLHLYALEAGWTANIHLNGNGSDDVFSILATPVGVTTTIHGGSGPNDLAVVGREAADANGTGDLAAIDGNLVINDAGNINITIDNGADASDRDWSITTPAAQTGLATISGVTGTIRYNSLATNHLRVWAGGGDDELTVDLSGGDGVTPLPFVRLHFHAGGQSAGDSMILTGGPVLDAVEHLFTNEHDGAVIIDAAGSPPGDPSRIDYTGLEPITDNLDVNNRVFTYTTAGVAGSLVRSAGALGADHTRIDSGANESVDFTTPIDTLTINLANGAANGFSVTSLADDFGAGSLDAEINLGDKGDVVNFHRTNGASGSDGNVEWTVNGGAGNDQLNLSPTDLDLSLLNDHIAFNGGGGALDTLNAYDNNRAAGDTYEVSASEISRNGWQSPSGGVTYNGQVEFVNLNTGGGDDVINVDSTSTAAETTISSQAGDDRFNIAGSNLGGHNHFYGGDNDDTFQVDVEFAPSVSAPLHLHGDANDFGGGVGSRDVVIVRTVGGFGGAATIAYTGNVGGSQATLDLQGGSSLITVDTSETIRWLDDQNNDDTITVIGTAASEDITVAPIGAHRALVFNGGDPWTAPPADFATSIPGVSGGSTAPDLDLSGLVTATGLQIQDAGGAGDKLYVYGETEGGLNDGNAFDPFGFGAGYIQPNIAAGDAYDTIAISDTATAVNGYVVVNYDTVDFSQPAPGVDVAVTINAGFEENPPATLGTDVADNITLTPSAAYRFQVNGGDPDPATTGIVPPDGDRLAPVIPGGVTTIDIYTDKNNPANVTISFPGAGILPFSYSSIENLRLNANPGTTINLIGDNGNNPGSNQTDNFVVVGKDVDGDPSDGGYQEAELFVNGAGGIYINNMAFLNVLGHEEIDTLELSPYADNSGGPGGNSPRGWGVQVFYDEGAPVGVDGDQADLLIYNTAAFGGAVSENIVIQPSDEEDGEVRVTNATDGSAIVTISYVNNLDIIVNDNDGFASDTDTLTLNGTNPDGPNTSGLDDFIIDLTAAGTPVDPMVNVRDATAVGSLYRLRSFTGFDTLNFAGLGGSDFVELIAGRDDGSVTINVDGGGPTGDGGVFAIDTVALDGVAGASDRFLYFPGATVDSGRLLVARSGAAAPTIVNYVKNERIDFDGGGGTGDDQVIVNGTGGNDAFTFAATGSSSGTVQVSGNSQIVFRALGDTFSDLILNGLGGDDAFSAQHDPGFEVGVTVNGGPPGGSDSFHLQGTPGDDEFTFSATSLNSGFINVSSGGSTITYSLNNVEHASVDGLLELPFDQDSLTVVTSDAVVVPGANSGDGRVDPVDVTGNPMLSLSYTRIAAVDVRGFTAVLQGTDEDDVIEVFASGIVRVTNELGYINEVDLSDFSELVINALGGDDQIFIESQYQWETLWVIGGDNGHQGPDQVILLPGAGLVEDVLIEPSGVNETAQEISGLEGGFGGPIFSQGIELISYIGEGDDDTLTVVAGVGDETTRVESQNRTEGIDRVLSEQLPEIRFGGLDTFRLDQLLGIDTATFALGQLNGAANYEVESSSGDAVIVEGFDGAFPDAFTVTSSPGGFAVNAVNDFDKTLTEVGFGPRLELRTLGGDDTVTIDNSDGLITAPIHFDGGLGSDILRLLGDTAIDSSTYTPGPINDSGVVVHIDGLSTQTVSFAGLEPVVDLVAAATLTVNGTNANNSFNYTQSELNAAWGKVAVDAFEVIHFVNKTTLVLSGLAGSDTFNLNNQAAAAPTGLTGITVQGGDPTAGSDVLIVNARTGGVNTFQITPTGVGAGGIVEAIEGILSPVNFTGIENLEMVGNPNDFDAVEYLGTAGDDTFTVTPGPSIDEGQITGFRAGAPTAGGFTFTPLEFRGFRNFVALPAFPRAGNDTLRINGTSGDDVFTYRDSPAFPTFPAVRVNGSTEIFSTAQTWILAGLEGNDAFLVDFSTLSTDRPYIPSRLRIEGGDSDGSSDSIAYIANAGATTTVDFAVRSIESTGAVPLSFSGVELINVNSGGGDAIARGGRDDDQFTVTPDVTGVETTFAGLNTLLRVANVDQFSVDGVSGADRLTVHATDLDNVIGVDGDSVDIPGRQLVEFVNIDHLEVFGHAGNDTFNVTPSADTTIFVDGGDPIGIMPGDKININAGGNPVMFQVGPESDEGGFQVGANRTISFDHIEMIGAIDNADCVIVVGTNADDDITIIARDASTHALADGIRDFTVSVNGGPDVPFINAAMLYVDGLSGDDDIVLRTPAPNNAVWDVDVFIAGGPPSAATADQGDVFELETPFGQTVTYTPTGSDSGVIDVVTLSSVITLGQFVDACPPLNYDSSPGGVEQFIYDGETGDDDFTIIGSGLSDTIVFTPGAAFDEGSLRVGALLGVSYQNLGDDATLTVDGAGAAFGGSDVLVVLGTGLGDTLTVLRTSGAVSLTNSVAAYLVIETANVEGLVLEGLEGDDRFEIFAPQPYESIATNGGGPGGSDVTSVFGAFGVDEDFLVNPGFANGDGEISVDLLAIPYSGVEHIFLDANSGDSDSLTIEDDLADNTWNVFGGPIFGDRVTIDNRETYDFDDFDTVTLDNDFGEDRFIIHSTQLVGVTSSLTVLADGGAPADDVIEIHATEAADTVTSTADATTVNGAVPIVVGAAGAGFAEYRLFTFGGVDNINLDLALPGVRKVVDAGAGNDTIDLAGMLDADIYGGDGVDTIIGTPLADNIYAGAGNDVVNGGGGDDNIYGGFGDDVLIGGAGVDNVYGEEGNDRFGDPLAGDAAPNDGGNDFFYGGPGADRFVWDPGDGSDTIQGGGDGGDVLEFHGSDGAEVFHLFASLSDPSHFILFRNLGNITMNTAGVEQVDLQTRGGADTVTVGRSNVAPNQLSTLQTTEVRVVNIDLAEPVGASLDNVIVEGRALNDNLLVSLSNGVVTVQGLPYDVKIANSTVAAGDRLTVNGNEGNDTIKSEDEAPGVESVINITFNGNAGDDYLSADAILNGGAGNDFLEGGVGDDTLNGNEGDDIFVGGAGADTIDGGPGVDTILVRATNGNDSISINQTAATTLQHNVNGNLQIDTLVTVAGTRTVERVKVEALDGDDTISVTWADSLGVDGFVNSLRVDVDGGSNPTRDRIGVIDAGVGDLILYRRGPNDDGGSMTVGPGNLEPLDATFINTEVAQPIAAADGDIVVFKHDPYEFNDLRVLATHLGASSSINVDPTVDPGLDPIFGFPADNDWYRLVAEKTGVLDFQVYFRQVAFAPSGRPGLPNAGNLDIQVTDAAGNVIAGFGVNDANDDERIRIPAVAGQTYYLRVMANGNALNNYNITVENYVPPTPYDLELNDIIALGTVQAGGNTLTTVNGVGAGLSTVDDFYNGKYIEFTSGALTNQRAQIVDYVGASQTFVVAAGSFTSIPAPGAEFQVESFDTGRSQFDNHTRDETPVIFFRLDDGIFLHDLPGNPEDDSPPDEVIPIPFQGGALAPGYRVAIFIEGTPQQPDTLPQVPVGYATMFAEGVYRFDFADARDRNNLPLLLTDGSHFISARVQMIDPSANLRTGFGPRSQSLEIVVDTKAPLVFFGDSALPFDGLAPDSDSKTKGDNITNDVTPTFWGRAEANAVIRVYADRTTNLIPGVSVAGQIDASDVLLGMTVAVPTDGTNQFPGGYWELTSNVSMNDPAFFSPIDGLRTILVSAEDLAGNVNPILPQNVQMLQIFIDTQPPKVNSVTLVDNPATPEDESLYDLFDPKPSTDGPTPPVTGIDIAFIDFPVRVDPPGPIFAYPALDPVQAMTAGNYRLIGDANGIIPIAGIQFIDATVPGDIGRSVVRLTFTKPLPDDRYTLIVDDNLMDPAGNNLDGESEASEPHEVPFFPSGDGVPGTDFVARFTVDSRPELGTWAAGSVYVDTNGNFVWDPQNLDFTNRDITYTLGFTSDDVFAGNFSIVQPVVATGDALFVIDVSGSTTDAFGGTPVGDLNNDGAANTILDAEIAGFIAINDDLIARGLGNTGQVSIVAFDSTGIQVDMDPLAPGVQLVTTPAADTDANGVRDVEQALRALNSGGGTNFEAALQTAITTVNTAPLPAGTTLVFLSDGFGSGDFLDEVATLEAAGIELRAFGVGPGSSLTQLQDIDPNAVQVNTTDELLDALGNGGGPGGGGADGFDKLAAYGYVNNAFRWLIDVTNDGVPDYPPSGVDPNGFNGVPIAGEFDGNPLNGEEVGLFDGSRFRFDIDHDFRLDPASDFVTSMRGRPVVGDFNGDGFDDLAVWASDRFQITLAEGGHRMWPANPQYAFNFGFIGTRERPVAADMNLDGLDDLGLWTPDRSGQDPEERGEWYWLLSNPMAMDDPRVPPNPNQLLDAVIDDVDGDGKISLIERIEPDPDLGGFEIEFTPTPFGDDFAAFFGDEFSAPVVGNFDPPLAAGEIDIEINGPFGVSEGGQVGLSATVQGGSSPYTYHWDLDGDGVYGETGSAARHGDETGETPTFWANGLDGGGSMNAPIRMYVTDSLGGRSFTVASFVNIENAAPTMGAISGASQGVTGQALEYTFQASDPSAQDAGALVYRIDWNGDGSDVQTVIGPASGVTVTHYYNAAGEFTIKVKVSDDDGATSSNSASHNVSIASHRLENGNLTVGGSAGDDSLRFVQLTDGRVRFNRNGAGWSAAMQVSGTITVHAGPGHDYVVLPDGVIPGVIHGGPGNDRLVGGRGADQIYGDADRDEIDGRHGNDRLFGGLGDDKINGNHGHDVIYAGAGNDRARGYTGNDLIFGEAGRDVLTGTTGNDVLVGGEGADRIAGEVGNNLVLGGGGRDLITAGLGGGLLIPEATSFDNGHEQALMSIMAEWSSSRSFDQRVNNILGQGAGVKANGYFLREGIEVFNDGVDNDTVGGSDESDLFYHLGRIIYLPGDGPNGNDRTV